MTSAHEARSAGSGVRESRLETLRTARVFFLGGGALLDSGEVWYVLHGYGQSARRFLARFSSIASPTRLIVAPEGLSRFYLAKRDSATEHAEKVGASWMTRDGREIEIEDYLRYLNRVALLAEQGVSGATRTLLGFSQGAHTAARWAIRGKAQPDRLILWGGGLPADLPDNAASRLQDARVVLVRGKEDALRRPDDEQREDEWLRKNRIRYRIQMHSTGHSIVPEVLDGLTIG